MKFMGSIVKAFTLSLCIIANTHLAYAQTASILPPAKTTFLDSNGNPLTAGKVDFYIPGTTTRKTTWQDAAETIPNTNPVTLDAAGRALVLGSGSYRQVVKDKLGNLIWDQVTSSSGSGGGGSIATGDGDLVGTIKPWAGMTAPNQYAFTYGQEVSRATFATLFTAMTSAQPVFCTSGSPVLSGLSDTTNLPLGGPIELSCVASGHTEVASKTATTITMAVNSNVTSNTTATFIPWGRGNGSTTFNLPDLRGRALIANNNMGGTAGPLLSSLYFGTDPNATAANGGNQSKTLIRSDLPNVAPIFTGSASTLSITSTFTGNAGTAINFSAAGAGNFNSGSFANIGVGGTVASTGSTVAAGTIQDINGAVTQTPFSIIQPSITSNYIIKVTPDTNSATAAGVTSLGSMTGDIACGLGLLCTGNNVSIVGSSSGVNVAALKAFVSPANGAVQYIDGYYLPGDGGEGQFTFSSTSTTTADDGVIIAPDTGSGRWIRNTYSTKPNVRWWGAKCDYSTTTGTGTDDSTAFGNAAGWAASVNGASILFPRGSKCAMAHGVSTSANNVAFEAEGYGSIRHNIGLSPSDCNASVYWTGAADLIMFLWNPNGGADARQIIGGGMRGLCLFGKGVAGYGIYMASVRNAVVDGVFIESMTANNMVVSVSRVIADTCDSQFNRFTNITISNINPESPTNGRGFVFDSYYSTSIANTGCNASLNHIETLHIDTYSNTALYLGGSDNNTWINVSVGVFLNNAPGLEFSFGQGDGTNLPGGTSSEHFFRFSNADQTVVRGSATCPGCVAPWGNWIYGLDKGNGTSDPVKDAGAGTISWINSSGELRGDAVWNATKIPLAYGGTNADLSATGGASRVLKQVSVGAPITVGQLSCSDLSGVGTGCSSPASISSLTGDVTATGPGAATATLATVNSNVGSFGSATQCVSFTTNGKGLITAASAVTCTPAIASITGFGTGVAAALAINVGTAGSIVVNGGALGTPSSGVLTNATGLPLTTGISGLGAGVSAFLGTPSSANLRSALTDESGTGAALFQNGDLGTPSAGVGTNLTGTAASLTAGNATKLTTPRAIGVGGTTGLTATGVNFDGSAAINPTLTGTLAVANGGTGDTGTVWPTFTATPTCGTATFTVTSSTWKSVGKIIFIEGDWTIATIGTCTNTITFTLPAPAATNGVAPMQEIALSSVLGACRAIAGGSTGSCQTYGGAALTAGMHLVFSGVYGGS